jgi:hypothetical protein
MWTKGGSCMSTTQSPLTQQTLPKPSLKAPLILLALMFVAASVGIRWVRSLSQAASPIFHQTKSGWQQLPSPAGFPEKLRVSSGGTVWVLTWGRTALSRWDGSRWRYYRDTGRGTKTSYRDGTFALDGEQVWSPAEQGVLHWDGQRWHSYSEVTPSQGASIVAGDGQVWIADDTGKLFHFEKGKWATRKLALPGMRSVPSPEAGSPELARTADGTVWLVWQRLWRLYGDIWLPGIADGKLLDHVTLIGSAGDRLWLSDTSGIRSLSADGSGKSHTEAQTGIPDEVTVDDLRLMENSPGSPPAQVCTNSTALIGGASSVPTSVCRASMPSPPRRTERCGPWAQLREVCLKTSAT